MPINIEIDSVGLLMKPRSSITMHATQKEVHAKIGDEDGEESQRHIHMTVHADAAMGRNGIDHQGDERPRLFWVPRPVGAPRHIRPDGTDEDAEAQTGEGRVEQQERQQLQVLSLATHAEGCQRGGTGQGQQGESHHDDADMDGQQRGVEHGHEVGNLRVHLRDVADQQEEA